METVYSAILSISDIAVTDAGIPSVIIKNADAGCPAVGGGGIAEKNISAAE